MSLKDNTRAKVRLSLREVINAGYVKLAENKEVPWQYKKDEGESEYRPYFEYSGTTGELDKAWIEFSLVPKEKEEPYQAGDWKDPELKI